MQRNFQRVAIVNRGEPAMRFIHAVREFNQERGTDFATIALFTEPDRHAMFVREADEALFIGPAQVLDPQTNQLKSSYVDYIRLESALTAGRADAVWVGWGFVAEHAEFAELCERLGIVFIGPSSEVMRRLGDKITSKLIGGGVANSRRPLERRPGGDGERRLAPCGKIWGTHCSSKPRRAAAATASAASSPPRTCRRRLKAPAPRRSRRSETPPCFWNSW